MAKIEEEKTVVQKVQTGYRCDRCDKAATYQEARDWVSFSHGHGAWGNDSCDSVEHFDLCSPQCYMEQLKLSADEVDGNNGAEVDDKPVGFVRALLKYLNSKDSPAYKAGYDDACDDIRFSHGLA